MVKRVASWKESVARVVEALERLDSERETLLKTTRELTRLARETVFSIHTGRLEEAGRLVEAMREKFGEIAAYREREPMLFYSGAVNNALTEYVEAVSLYMVVKEWRIPTLEELDATYSSYLAGLGDLVGELRRYALNMVREGSLEKAWRALSLMEEIYVEVSKLSFPEALIPGVRHKMDVARSLIENTRKDLLFYEKSGELISALKDALRVFGEASRHAEPKDRG